MWNLTRKKSYLRKYYSQGSESFTLCVTPKGAPSKNYVHTLTNVLLINMLNNVKPDGEKSYLGEYYS